MNRGSLITTWSNTWIENFLENIHLKILEVNSFHPGHSSIMYKIFLAYVPVIGRYLYVHFFVRIEWKRWKFHYFTGRL